MEHVQRHAPVRGPEGHEIVLHLDALRVLPLPEAERHPRGDRRGLLEGVTRMTMRMMTTMIGRVALEHLGLHHGVRLELEERLPVLRLRRTGLDPLVEGHVRHIARQPVAEEQQVRLKYIMEAVFIQPLLWVTLIQRVRAAQQRRGLLQQQVLEGGDRTDDVADGEPAIGGKQTLESLGKLGGLLAQDTCLGHCRHNWHHARGLHALQEPPVLLQEVGPDDGSEDLV
mmetsp:Transcript_51939/g.138333  ORF Transcript_51939/g.138333 Transcript_51939/m.138333 type:complete len:227 (+) Transcript_51939:633-1313(+)